MMGNGANASGDGKGLGKSGGSHILAGGSVETVESDDVYDASTQFSVGDVVDDLSISEESSD